MVREVERKLVELVAELERIRFEVSVLVNSVDLVFGKLMDVAIEVHVPASGSVPSSREEEG